MPVTRVRMNMKAVNRLELQLARYLDQWFETQAQVKTESHAACGR